ncbi:MAG: hypothetical protein GX039_04980 [Clostridia bacterium]|nr:hypothetical protein [Clostridia bacterium]
MAIWQCTECGYEKEARCKPRKCPQCEAKGTFSKSEDSSSANKSDKCDTGCEQ